VGLGNDNPIESWGNQAIRLPRHMELNADQVLIEKHGEVLTIRPRRRCWLAGSRPFPADIDGVDVESDGANP
jgi:virulence-associated protein VagC